MPLIEKMVWPFFIVLGLFVFQEEVNGLYNQVTKDGRAMKLGSFFEIGEKIQNTDIQTFATKDLSIQAVHNGDFSTQPKGGREQLRRIQDDIEDQNMKFIDALEITNDKIYVRELLLEYISTLGVKYILFENDGVFDGWMYSSIFSGQLLERAENEKFNYQDITDSFAGMRRDQIASNTKTSEVLQKMKVMDLDDIAVVDGSNFNFMLNKQAIINELVANALITSDIE